ncbi:hypothetical protein KUTeg_024435 [Tegillarca granosa]|uniref:Brain tumor protein n=1 Tax=Tegillarca granosa TaxID=220873 RepID=A0ABQ9DXA1_TEGGR|nr:hypothetical protein KUTeg_024435 [Tegillarca granosa]
MCKSLFTGNYSIFKCSTSLTEFLIIIAMHALKQEGKYERSRICEEKLDNPKILSCLHVFCQKCIEKQVEESAGEECPLPSPRPQDITCTICKQDTKIPSNGVEDLPSDYVIMDMLEMSAIEDMQIVCTSCKAKEKAVARCCDCASFLCANCVVSFEDLQSLGDGAIHKPIFCFVHPMENMKYFCNTCQVPICNECMMGDHKQPEHHYERISDVEEKIVEDLKGLVTECKSKVSLCEESSNSLQNALTELQMQRDNAKGLINETFQSYKAILEKKRDDLLQELESLHSSQELAIMDLFHTVEKTTERVEGGCEFTERVLKHGSSLQMLLMKKLITTQLLSLINNTPKPEINIDIEFHTDNAQFEESVNRSFGSFSKEEPKVEPPLSSLHSSFENEGFSLPSGVLSPGHPIMSQSSASDFVPHLPPITPVSMVDSLSNFGTGPNMPPVQVSMGMAITGGTQAIHEATSLSRNSHSPAMSDSGISVDAASNNSGSSAPMINIAALAKLGSVNYQGLPPSSGTGSGTQTPISQTDTNISSLLNTPTPRSQTPNIETLAGLLQQQTPQISGMGNLGAIGSVGANGSGMNMSSNNSSNFNTPVATTPYPPVRRGNKMSAMQIRCKFGQLGPGKGQFNSPHGFCLGSDEDIIVADTNNHRIQIFEKTGEFKYQFGIPGREEGQLWYPRKVAVIRSSGKFVVCDRGNERSRMQIFTRNGHFVKKIAIRYIDIVAGLAISQQGHIVAVDSVSPTVFCISEAGDLIKWFDCSDYMREPSDIAISGKEYFVCDFKGHCVVVFNEDGQFLRRIGCENITNYPNGIDISDAGDVLIGDSHGNRFHVAVFQRDGSLIGEFECPYVKVSRCCGLKITSEGYVVTLAKNNHHVLVLNTLYIT